MHRLVIFFIIMSFSSLSFSGKVYAEDAIDVYKPVLNSAPKENPETAAVVTTVSNTDSTKIEYADYPKSFIIPKGVCEIDQPPAAIVNLP